MMNGDGQVRPLWVLLTVVIAVTFLGFAIGTSDEIVTRAPIRTVEPPPPAAEGLAPAPAYLGMRAGPPSRTGAWEADREVLAALLPATTDEVSFDGTDKAADLARRAARRAYDGAPPTVPHPVRQDTAMECAACHEAGLRIRGRTAPAVPHATYTSCMQCHVVERAPMGAVDWLPEPWPAADTNAFAGRTSPEQGDQWGTSAPEIPHRTFMRERCDSCHGPAARDAIRSSHPYRQSCEQCHASSAAYDQR